MRKPWFLAVMHIAVWGSRINLPKADIDCRHSRTGPSSCHAATTKKSQVRSSRTSIVGHGWISLPYHIRPFPLCRPFECNGEEEDELDGGGGTMKGELLRGQGRGGDGREEGGASGIGGYPS